MIRIALALVVLGVIGLFFSQWIGAPVAIAGILLAIVALARSGGRAADGI